MREVNRSALILTAKPAFLDWVREVDASSSDLTLEDINEEPVIYLVPEFESDEEFAKWVEGHFDDIFQEQLAGWWTDQRLWPTDRSVRLFQNWFDCQSHSVVLDVVPGRLSRVE
ncbi:MAG TPA: hypothetical protein VGK48_07915 [Terriglobia bacterium]|jgi:hypothetical protein